MLSGLLGVLVATNQPSALSNLVHEKTGAKIEVTQANDPVEREYHKLLEMDQAAQDEVERWLEENQRLAATGAGDSQLAMRQRMTRRFEPVEKAYRDFLARNPNHVKARIALGSFLGDIGREDDGAIEYVKARELDPKNPTPWNNLANYYGHNGPVTNAFACYEKAIELNPKEPVYFQNFATTVYLFRRDATNYYRLSEQQVFDKALGLYRQAMALTPQDFKLATDYAQTFYGIQPPRVTEAMKAWNDAMKVAGDDLEREGVRIHLARWYRTAGDADGARQQLNLVTNQMFAPVKANILKSLNRTNSPAGSVK